MIDIHSHFLYGVDDGPENRTETEKLLEKYEELGFTTVIETTHCYPGLYEIPLEQIKSQIKQLNSTNIYFTREYFVDFNFLEKLKEGKIIPYPDNKHILIEFSFMIPPINWEHLVFNIETAGYYPVLAHPERYEWLTSVPNFIQDFKRRGGMLQGNMGSLLGHYGRYARRNFKKITNDKLYDFMATDTHSLDQLISIGDNLRNIKKEIGDSYFYFLTEENPQILLEK